MRSGKAIGSSATRPTDAWTGSIEVPVRKPTCCAFGGSDLVTLFITTSRLGETAEALAREPLAGALFALRPGVSGCEDTPFGG